RVDVVDPAQDPEAAKSRDEQVENDGARPPALHLKAGLDAIAGGEDNEPLVGEVLLQRLQHLGIVVNTQDAGKAFRHRVRLLAKRPARTMPLPWNRARAP